MKKEEVNNLTLALGKFCIACAALLSNKNTSVNIILSSNCFNSFNSSSVIVNA